jgi:chitinase
MTHFKKNIATILTLIVFFPVTTHASLTLYTTSWSMYGNNAYEYDGAYKNGRPYGQLEYVTNNAMVAQFNKADRVAWSFFQVWNNQDPT